MNSGRRDIRALFDSNRDWARRMHAADPAFFLKLSEQQSPRYLWIGCSDSRVPANEIVGLPPGDLFVHRNIANQVIHTDLNCLSVIQFAVELLKVEHIIVCGHYGCSGVRVAVQGETIGLCDHWLRYLQDLYVRNSDTLPPGDGEDAIDRLCELNVIEQVVNVARSKIVRAAWSSGQPLEVHGWIYGIRDGLLKDLGVSVANAVALERLHPSTVGSTTGPA
jgi:carbonic anhydrase